ncbi:hypothetical protein ACH4CD_09665 [Streptomyces fungicidicus]
MGLEEGTEGVRTAAPRPLLPRRSRDGPGERVGRVGEFPDAPRRA